MSHLRIFIAMLSKTNILALFMVSFQCQLFFIVAKGCAI